MTSQVCISCGVKKLLSNFWRQRSKRNGYQSECKKCMKIRNSNWHKSNQGAELSERQNSATRRYRKRNPLVMMLRSAKDRAAHAGLPFELTIADIVIPVVCPVLGIPIISSMGTGKRWSDFSPSIDRVDNHKGYVSDNVVIISYRANRIKSDSTLDELRKIVRFYEHRRRHNDHACKGGGLPEIVQRQSTFPLPFLQPHQEKESR